MNLPAAAAGHAGDNPGSLFRASAVANFAEFQTRQPDFRVYSRRRLFKTQFHVVAEVRAALGTIARAASSKNILEAKKIAEDILKFIKNSLIDAAIESTARKPCVSVAVVGDALLRFRKNRVRFGGFPKSLFRFLFLLRIAVRMPLQCCLAVGGFNFVGSCGAFDSEHFITIAFFTHRLILQVSLIFKLLCISAFAGMDYDADK